jgi:pumilio RNA-binding family
MFDSLNSSVNKSLKGKWASLPAMRWVHLSFRRPSSDSILIYIQDAFENLEADAKDGIVDEPLNHGSSAYCGLFLRLSHS